jgi:hypothetical protein
MGVPVAADGQHLVDCRRVHPTTLPREWDCGQAAIG